MRKVIALLMTIVLIVLIPVSAWADGLSTAQRVSQARAGNQEATEPTAGEDKEGYIYIWSEKDGIQYVKDDKYFELKNAVKKRISDICYYDAEFSEIEVSVDTSFDDNDHRIVSVHLKWEDSYSAKSMKKWSLECSDDLAAFLAEEYDYTTELYVWWYSKSLASDHKADKRFADETKFHYEFENGYAYFDFATGPLFDFKNYTAKDRFKK